MFIQCNTIYIKDSVVTKKELLKTFVRFQVKKALLERQEPQVLEPNRIGKVEKYTKALPLLDKSLTLLMSPKYRHFIKDIQIISPKPSTFKVILNNDYFIYLTYNHGAISAEVEGKNYSLVVNQEAQRASKAITELLKFTMPNVNKQEVNGESIDSYEGPNGGGSLGSSPNAPMPQGGNGVDTELGPQNGPSVGGNDFDASADAEIDRIINQA